jgi:hypothetical protein
MEAVVLTAKMTAKLTDKGARERITTDSEPAESNLSGRCWMVLDASPAVFKTVCGALLRRPGWVRFPSIPARFSGGDIQRACWR